MREEAELTNEVRFGERGKQAQHELLKVVARWMLLDNASQPLAVSKCSGRQRILPIDSGDWESNGVGGGGREGQRRPGGGEGGRGASADWLFVHFFMMDGLCMLLWRTKVECTRPGTACTKKKNMKLSVWLPQSLLDWVATLEAVPNASRHCTTAHVTIKETEESVIGEDAPETHGIFSIRAHIISAYCRLEEAEGSLDRAPSKEELNAAPHVAGDLFQVCLF